MGTGGKGRGRGKNRHLQCRRGGPRSLHGPNHTGKQPPPGAGRDHYLRPRGGGPKSHCLCEGGISPCRQNGDPGHFTGRRAGTAGEPGPGESIQPARGGFSGFRSLCVRRGNGTHSIHRRPPRHAHLPSPFSGSKRALGATHGYQQCKNLCNGSFPDGPWGRSVSGDRNGKKPGHRHLFRGGQCATCGPGGNPHGREPANPGF